MRRATLALTIAVAALAAPAILPAPAAADLSFCPPGSGAGQCSEPEAIGADFSEDLLFVAERGNDRISVFEVDGAGEEIEFLRSFGWDVVASGPGNVPAPDEEQSVALGANTTGGTFRLRFESQFTSQIAFDAPAASVEAALNALPTIGGAGGSVSVSGPAGGPWTVAFGGSLAERDVPQMSGNGFNLTVSGGAKSVTVETLVQGGAFEVCEAAAGDVCAAGSAGGRAGQLDTPGWLAVDNTSEAGSEPRGDVYVADRNDRVSRFDADGSFVRAFGWGVLDGSGELQACTTATGCEAGIEGPEECQMGGVRQPVSVGPEGRVFAANTFGAEPNFTNKVMAFSPEGGCLGETTLFAGNLRIITLAVDGAEDAYVGAERDGVEARKFDLGEDETLLCELDPGVPTNSLAIDAAGHLLAGQREPDDSTLPGGGDHLVIAEYEADACPPSGQVRRFGYGKFERNVTGVAALSSVAGEVFGADRQGIVRYLEHPPPGPLLTRLYDPFEVGNVRAGVAVEANPEGEESEVEIQYVSDADFAQDTEEGGNGFEGEGVTSLEAPVPFEAGMEYRARAVEALLGCEVASEEAIEDGDCLVPETTYHWRARATNPSGEGEGWQAGQSFTTEPPVAIEAFATGVSTDTATINAAVDPLGIPASGYFEYVDEQAFQQSGFTEAQKVPDIDVEPPEAEYDFGGGEGRVRRSATIHPLQPGTSYRFRLVASNSFFAGIEGETESFTTHSPPEELSCPNGAERLGPAARLPDCRAYELVSPVDKQGGDIIILSESLTRERAVLEQSAASGERLAYGSYRAFGDAKSAPYTSQYVARRVPGSEWRSHAINPPEEGLIKDEITLDNEYRAFSDDLCEGWLVPLTEPTLAAGAVPGFLNLYRRTDQLCGGAPDYEAITTAPPTDAEPGSNRVEPQGTSADGQTTAFATNDSLVGTGAPNDPGAKQQLYVKGPEGGPTFACVLPGGAPSGEPCSAGTSDGGLGKTRRGNMAGALSEDGARIYWTGADGPGPLYLRENPLASGFECAGAGSPCTTEVAAGGASFWGASADGSAAYYTTGNLSGGIATLHRFEAASGESEAVAEAVYGFMGASEDAAVAYFASGEVLGGENSEGEEAAAGEPNLYRYQAGSGEFEFVATLADDDVAEETAGEESSATARQPVKRSSRVASDGMTATFMSAAPLTGYDNTDAASLAPCGAEGGICDTEVYLHEAGGGELLCVSCNPSGARPEGEDANTAEGEEFWVAARTPAWETTLYAPGVLSPDGERVFFESADPLVPRDANGRFDVYQWEREGKGTCTPSRPTYSSAAKGCIDLISSGQSVRDARILDASPDGRDVFFATLRSLLPQDPDLVDVYDARVGGGLPVPEPPPAECEGEGCQSPAAAPEFALPGTATYTGPANLSAPTAARGRCARPARKAKRHARRAKSKRRQARRAARAGKRRAARRQMRGAKRNAKAARKLSGNAKRCRARARQARRAGR